MKLILTLIIAATHLHAFANTGEIKDKVEGVENLIAIEGTTSGYNEYYKKQNKRHRGIDRKADGFVDFGLVLPSITKKDLISFDLNNFISPKSDVLRIVGQEFEVPSNLSLPKQKESYIISVRINKPNFTAYVNEHDVYNMNVLHGRFEVKPVVDKIRKDKPIFDLLNDFNFLGGGQLQIDSRDKSTIDIDVNNYSLVGKANVTAPEYNGNEFTIFSMPLESVDGLLHPTDLKYVNSNNTQTITINTNGNPSYTLNVLTNKVQKVKAPNSSSNARGSRGSRTQSDDDLYRADFSRMTMNLLPTTENSTPVFLDIPAVPSVSEDGLMMTLVPPQMVEGITPLATVIELVQSELFKNGVLVSEHKEVLWSQTLDNWVTDVELEGIDFERVEGATYRYEVSFVAADDSTVMSSSEVLDLSEFAYLTKNYLVID